METTRTTQRKDRPDPAGVVRRGEAAEYIRAFAEKNGEPPRCWVGKGLGGVRCERPAVMEVYGLTMCEVHSEEAAAGALEEIAYDLEQELQLPTNGFVRPLSPHIEAALRRGYGVLEEEGETNWERPGPLLLAAFPLDRARVDEETLAYYAGDLRDAIRRRYESPYEMFERSRMLLHRLMRLAFEEGADWLVHALEGQRESVAEQAAYALALDPTPPA